MSDEPKKDDVEALAALVGSVNAELGQIDEQIISSSANLQRSKESWDPKSVLKQEIHAVQGAGSLQAQAPVPQQPTPVQQPVQVPAQAAQPPSQPPSQQYVQPQAFITDPQILQRLDRIELALKDLSITEDKIMKSLLKNNTKQITIRFDDSKSSK